MKSKVFSIIRSSWLTWIVTSSKASIAFFICILAVTFAYRIQLVTGLLNNPVRPFDFDPGSHPLWFMFSYVPYDFILASVCYLLSWLLSRVKVLVKEGKGSLILTVSGFLFLHLFLIGLLVVHRAHLRVLFNVQTGLDYSIIKEAIWNISVVDLLKFVEIRDYLFLLLPIGLFWSVLLSPLALRIWAARTALTLVVALSLGSVFGSNYRSEAVPAELRFNPALFLLSDLADQSFYKATAEDRKTDVVPESGSGLQLTGPAYAHPFKPVKFLPSKNDHPWNIIIFVMESVGTRYMFDTSYGNKMPMPFLHKISKEGWYLKRHYTTSNVSSKADFSILSGLYDFFNRETFSTRSDVRVPSIHNFLGRNYDSFFVTPSSLSWYFPSPLLKNSGIRDIHSYENLNFRIKETYHSLGHYIARDEVETVEFLIQRINKAREPFLGIYVSFAAHFPYFDYGEDYSIMEDKERSISRYYNNLNLLDHMIKRIHDNLERQGVLERTLFVILGDHGQAFGQHHPDNYMHYRYSYGENLETPAILYQPALFKPKTFERATNHADLLPTLLDAMRIPYNPSFFDGESLFQNRLKRKYIFFYGLEESVSSLDTNQIKVQYSLKKDKCRVFDLRNDPEEKNPLECSSYRVQVEALRRFVNYHDARLVKYNESINGNPDFQARQPAF